MSRQPLPYSIASITTMICISFPSINKVYYFVNIMVYIWMIFISTTLSIHILTNSMSLHALQLSSISHLCQHTQFTKQLNKSYQPQPQPYPHTKLQPYLIEGITYPHHIHNHIHHTHTMHNTHLHPLHTTLSLVNIISHIGNIYHISNTPPNTPAFIYYNNITLPHHIHLPNSSTLPLVSPREVHKFLLSPTFTQTPNFLIQLLLST